jgi:hypothetical protein
MDEQAGSEPSTHPEHPPKARDSHHGMSHPVGTGLGAAAGGLAGAAMGSAIAGPLGTAVGAVAGGIVGAVTGRSMAETANPLEDDEIWRRHHGEQEWAEHGSYEEYAGAYKFGAAAAREHGGRPYHEVETRLALDYEKAEPGSALPWDRARPAVKSAWDRMSGVIGPRDTDRGFRGGI